MALIKNGRLADDPWTALADDAALPPTGPVIVSLGRFRAERDRLLSRGAPLGVRLKSSELAAEIGADASRLDLVAIEFPTFRDGRGYSTARLLRERWGFAGELRAVGDVLRDQLQNLRRCGFDAFALREGRDPEDALPGLRDFSEHYQTAVTEPQPLFRRRAGAGEAA